MIPDTVLQLDGRQIIITGEHLSGVKRVKDVAEIIKSKFEPCRLLFSSQHISRFDTSGIPNLLMELKRLGCRVVGLKITGINMNTELVTSFSSFLEGLALATLAFDNLKFDVFEMRDFFIALRKTKFENFYLSNLSYFNAPKENTGALQSLFRTLGASQCLLKVYLYRIPLENEESIGLMFDCLSLKTVSIRYCGLYPRLTDIMCKSAAKSRVTTFDLSHNPIKDTGVASICEMLKSGNSHVHTMVLNSCFISSRGMIQLGNALNHNRTLKSLLLHNNIMGMKGAQAMHQMLQYNASVQQLFLGTGCADYSKKITEKFAKNQCIIPSLQNKFRMGRVHPVLVKNKPPRTLVALCRATKFPLYAIFDSLPREMWVHVLSSIPTVDFPLFRIKIREMEMMVEAISKSILLQCSSFDAYLQIWDSIVEV